MRPEDFSSSAAGSLTRALEGHWTFEPRPLPPPLSFDLPLLRILSEADQALGRLAGVGRMMPNPHLLIRPFIRREATLSSKIEGTMTELAQLFLFETDAEDLHLPDDAGEVRNYVLAMEYGLERLQNGMPLSLRLLRELHERLMNDVRGGDKRPGEFRNCPVLIGRRGERLANARFVPPAPNSLAALLKHFEIFLNRPGDLPVVVQIALAHYQFEAIHPFMDGNGRVGRLLITMLLCERGVLPQPLLYLSAFFEKNREEYYDGLYAVSTKGSWVDWITFVARGVAEQSRDAVARINLLLDLADNYRLKVRAARPTAGALALVDQLMGTPFITARQAAQKMHIAYNTAVSYIGKLVKLGILSEITGKRRDRIYKADEVIALLDRNLDIT